MIEGAGMVGRACRSLLGAVQSAGTIHEVGKPHASLRRNHGWRARVITARSATLIAALATSTPDQLRGRFDTAYDGVGPPLWMDDAP